MRIYHVLLAASVVSILSACSKPAIQEAVAIDDAKLKTFKKACVIGSANGGYEKEAEDLQKFTILRMNKKQTFEEVTVCTPKTAKGVLKIALNVKTYVGGQGALKAFTGAGDAEISYSGKLSDDAGDLGEFNGAATSQSRGGSFSVGGVNVSGAAGMRDRVLANAADDVNKYLNDRRTSEK